MASTAIRHIAFAAFALGMGMSSSLAETPETTSTLPSEQCRIAIDKAERAQGVPDHLLAAIGQVESGRRDPTTGQLTPWPWTIDVGGQGTFFTTEAEGIAAVRALQTRGVRSIDIGCVQINILHHPRAFHSLEEAFDPGMNAQYGAAFLLRLFAMMGSWTRAVASYHSATPALGAAYARQVLAALFDRHGSVPVARRVMDAQPGGLLRQQFSLTQAAILYKQIQPLEGTVAFGSTLVQSLRLRAKLYDAAFPDGALASEAAMSRPEALTTRHSRRTALHVSPMLAISLRRRLGEKAQGLTHRQEQPSCPQARTRCASSS